MERPTHAQISEAITTALWHEEIIEAATDFTAAMGFDIENPEDHQDFSTYLYDFTHLAMTAATTMLVEHLFGSGSMDAIIDEYVDAELAKILAAG